MESSLDSQDGEKPPRSRWRSFFGRKGGTPGSQPDQANDGSLPSKWSMGVLNDRETHEVPGSVLLLANLRNEPLGLRNAPARTSHSSLPSQYPSPSPTPSRRQMRRAHSDFASKKKTSDGTIVLEPQPEDSDNDPLNWPAWRRDSALLSLGLYCMVGGGMTSVLAAGFTDVAETYSVSVPQVALTTGLYMMGLGVGSVFASPTAILYGKRPVYLAGCVLFVATSVWCAASPSYPSLVAARVLQGMSVSPVECLPSATIAEIFFLHERAYRIGIYTLLLLGGKNLVPLVSAAIIEGLDWRWVFWIVAIVVGFCGVLVFFFVPETFWDRTPRPRGRTLSRLPSVVQMYHSVASTNRKKAKDDGDLDEGKNVTTLDSNVATPNVGDGPSTPRPRPGLGRKKTPLHVGFSVPNSRHADGPPDADYFGLPVSPSADRNNVATPTISIDQGEAIEAPIPAARPQTSQSQSQEPGLAATDLSSRPMRERAESPGVAPGTGLSPIPSDLEAAVGNSPGRNSKTNEKYTTVLRSAPKRSFIQQLRLYEGRLHQDNWFRVAMRPFILFAYPAVLWSATVYACSVGWLIVLSETVAVVYRNPESYNFSALGTGLIYLSPFIGGVLGTVVAGKVSDVIVRALARRNGGLYEPEFRLVMAAPVALTTVIGLMGFGWSAENHDAWIVPTIFFGMMSFGCTLGSTTAITFCVDSYRQYAGEALVTLNFSKNIFHGLVFSLFVNKWIDSKGLKDVFLALGGIQLALLAMTIPMYIYGKRARMWTVRMNLMERF
ncbi:hypothetical protein V494_05823 [Pseudogymnoascus sp. VKM F-4513 (FW-928)]|nr:hypothetical protein V494_05823 [Pseudogymnoascus sp. VKM F-4513 (FW-928)]